MARTGPSAADRALLEHLQRRGLTTSAAQLERWRGVGILPPNLRTYLGRGRGSTSTLNTTSVEVAEAMSIVTRRGRSIYEAVLRVFTVDPRHNDLFQLPGVSVRESALRAALEWFVRSGDQTLDRRIERMLQRSSSTDESIEIIMRLTLRQFRSANRNPPPLAEYWPPLWGVSDYKEAASLATFAVGNILGIEEIGPDRVAEILAELFGKNLRLDKSEIKDGLEKLKAAIIAQELAGHQAFKGARRSNIEETINQLKGTDIGRVHEVRNKLAFVAEMGHLFLTLGGSSGGEPMATRMLDASTNSFSANFLLHSITPIAVTLETSAWHRMTAILVMILTDIDQEYSTALDELAFAAAPERFREMTQ